MEQTGTWNQSFGVDALGIAAGAAHYNLLPPALGQEAIRRGEGDLGPGGSLSVQTGEHTGRSPKDNLLVDVFIDKQEGATIDIHSH